MPPSIPQNCEPQPYSVAQMGLRAMSGEAAWKAESVLHMLAIERSPMFAGASVQYPGWWWKVVAQASTYWAISPAL